MKKLLLALALFLIPALAQAQCNGVFPNNTVCGNITGANNTPRPTNPTSFLGAAGGTNGQIQYNNNSTLGGLSTLNNSYLTPGAANTMKGSLNGTTTTDIAITACSLTYQITKWVAGTGWACGLNPVLPSRAIAATLNLSAFTSITTQSYATPSDGGRATFANIATAAFRDATPTWSLTTAGTGCTNGSYFGVHFTSTSTGIGAYGNATVSGGIVTSSNISTPGVGFAIGDTITTSTAYIPGCTTAPVWTATAVTTPTGSFTDSAGNHWQIQIDQNNGINATAFGLKNDWTPVGTDTAATNNTTFLQNALWFAYGQGVEPTIDAYGTLGATVYLPTKASMTCALELPQGVWLRGAGRYSTVLKECDSEPAANNFITVGDSLQLSSCFGSRITDMGIYHGSGTANSGVFMVFSNCIQQARFMERVVVLPNVRGGINLDTGYGGAALIGMSDIECGTGSATTNPCIRINYSTAIIDMQNIITEVPGTAIANSGVVILAGRVSMLNYHCEGYDTCIFMNVPANTGISSFHQLTASQPSCSNLVKRQTGSFASVNVIGMATGCTNTLNNAGTATTGNIIADTVF